MLVEVEHGADRAGQVAGRHAVKASGGVLAQIEKRAVQVAKATRLNVGERVDRREHALDDLEDLLACSGDQVPIAAPVVVLEARRVADRRRDGQVPPAAEALQPVGNCRRIHAGINDRGFGRNILGGELREERPGEHAENRPVLAPLGSSQIPEQRPGALRPVAVGVRMARLLDAGAFGSAVVGAGMGKEPGAGVF